MKLFRLSLASLFLLLSLAGCARDPARYATPIPEGSPPPPLPGRATPTTAVTAAPTADPHAPPTLAPGK